MINKNITFIDVYNILYYKNPQDICNIYINNSLGLEVQM